MGSVRKVVRIVKTSKVEVKIDLGDQVIEILKEGDRPSRAYFTNPLTVRNLENSRLWIEVLRPIMEALDVDFSEEPNEVVGYKRKPVRLGDLSADTVFYILPDGENAYEITHKGKIITMYCKEFNLFYSLPPDANVWVDVPKRKQVAFGCLKHDDRFYLDDSSSSVHKKKTNGPNANGYKYNAVKPFDDTWIHLLAYDPVYIDRKDE